MNMNKTEYENAIDELGFDIFTLFVLIADV